MQRSANQGLSKSTSLMTVEVSSSPVSCLVLLLDKCFDWSVPCPWHPLLMLLTRHCTLVAFIQSHRNRFYIEFSHFPFSSWILGVSMFVICNFSFYIFFNMNIFISTCQLFPSFCSQRVLPLKWLVCLIISWYLCSRTQTKFLIIHTRPLDFPCLFCINFILYIWVLTWMFMHLMLAVLTEARRGH